MEVSIFDVKAHGQSHVRIGGQLFAAGVFSGGPAEVKNRCVFAAGHFGAQLDLDGAAITGIGHKLPDRRRPGRK